MLCFAPWSNDLIREMIEFRFLKEGWDSCGASEIQPATIMKAIVLIHKVIGPDTPKPHVCPTGMGGVQFEWHINGCEFEFDIDLEGKIDFYFEGDFDPESKKYATQIEGEATSDNLIKMRKYVALLTNSTVQ